jgi:hypothetical protein
MFTPKIWLRLSAFAVAGSSAAASTELIHLTESSVQMKAAVGQVDDGGSVFLAQQEPDSGEGGEGGEAGVRGTATPSKSVQEQKPKVKPRRGLGV